VRTGLTTHRLALDRHLGFGRSEQRYEFLSPAMPGDPMRVQPSRAKRPTSENG